MEQRTEINRLTREVRATRERALELEEEADRLRQRLQARPRDSLEKAEDGTYGPGSNQAAIFDGRGRALGVPARPKNKNLKANPAMTKYKKYS